MARSVSPAARAPSNPISTATSNPPARPASAASSASTSSAKQKRPTSSRATPAFSVDAPRPLGSRSASTRAGSAPVPKNSRMRDSSSSVAPVDGFTKAAVREILGAQETVGVGRMYSCRLEDGRRVQRSRDAVLSAAPALLAAFEAANPPPSPSTSPEADGSDDSEVVVMRTLRGGSKKDGKMGKGKRRAEPSEDDGEDEESEMRDASSAKDDAEDGDAGASSDEPDDPGDEDVSAPSGSSSSSSGDGDAGSAAESEDDELGFRRSRRAQAKKQRAAKAKKPDNAKRRSTRGATRQGKRYDFGDGRAAAPSSDEDEGSAQSTPPATRKSSRRARATATLSSSSGSPGGDGADDAERGASSDELSMQAQPKKARGSAPTSASRAVVEDSEDEYRDEDVDELASESSGALAVDEDADERPQDHHRETCAKCSNPPASVLLAELRARRTKKKPARRRKRDDFEEDTDAEQDRAEKYGAWVECGVCCQSYHFGCLPLPQKRELTAKLKAEHLAPYASAGEAPTAALDTPSGSKSATPQPANVPPRPKHELDPERIFALPKCPPCKNAGGRKCFVCGLSGRRITPREKEELGARLVARKAAEQEGVVETEQDEYTEAKKDKDALKPGLMFRCSKCKRVAHYGCLENDEPGWTFEQHVQSYADWAICHDCYNYNVPLDVILAWAEADPLPAGDGDDVESDDEVVEPVVGEQRVDEKTKKVVVVPSSKDLRANAKYLVKWQDMSYRQLDWVPHAFLAAAYQSKLSGFLARGSLVKFEAAKDDDPEDDDPTDGDDNSGEAPLPDPNALERIPEAWRTVDRVLDVWYTHPKTGSDVAFADYHKKLPADPEESIKLVSQCYIKWGDLAYAQSTTEEPPKEDEPGYDAYVAAYKAFLVANSPKMRIPTLNKKQMDELDKPRDPKRFVEITEQPDSITGKLHDFQIVGVNFLRYQWWLRKGCILADEMGLGKTCQVISFLTYLNQKEGARPFLVIVPNSLIGNWMREFAKWAPTMRVVPYNGDGESRKIVEDYELFDAHGSLKTHVVLATYEAVAGNARVFRKVDRWDCLVVDEGQRLKAGPDSQLYGAIASLRVAQRVILSGTPLNNNIKELFNLLAFINPDEYDDIDALVEQYAELTPARVDEIRKMLQPYFLRRTKDLVLKLPPLLELVVPVSMTVLQRRIYRGILERNAAVIRSIVQTSSSSRTKPSKGKKGSFTNILMELRKALCHPYLVDADMEPLASAQEAHRNLTNASAKFVLLAQMLPKLKAAGHRVLIFSQFKITLNIIERFLAGLELKYLRLDGDTPQLERQRGVDKYNAPGSEYFAYLLSTRAGGVGLNITSADVVIIYDQDFNPQMDLQAISRAHRMGQTRPVRVFKLVVKGTCEEKILNAGNKKRGLEHLIIQRIDTKDESEDVKSMLQFGAQAVFDEEAAEASAIRYSDADIDDLLAKTADPTQKETDSAATFAQAQMWVREKGDADAASLSVAIDGAVDADDGEGDKHDLHDFWSKIVEQQQDVEKASKAAQAINVGRGKRRRTQVNYKLDVVSPKKSNKTKDGSPHSTFSELSSGDEYRHRDELDSDDEAHEPMEVDNTLADDAGAAKLPPLARGKPGVPPYASVDAGPSAPPAKKQRPSLTPAERAERDLRKAHKRREKLVWFVEQASRAGCLEARILFQQALGAPSRTLQTHYMKTGVGVFNEKASAFIQEALADNAAALNTASSVVPAPAAATFAKPPAPRPSYASAAAVSRPRLSMAAVGKQEAPVYRPPQVPIPVSQNAVGGPSREGSVPAAISTSAFAPAKETTYHVLAPPSQAPKEAIAAAPAPTAAAAAVAPALPGNSSVATAPVTDLKSKSPPGSMSLVRADSCQSDSSSRGSGSDTPRLKQMQLSFGKPASKSTPAPAPAAAPASAASSSQGEPVASAVPAKRSSPPGASAAPASKKRASPVAVPSTQERRSSAATAPAAVKRPSNVAVLVLSDSE
ncbi:hypothetical protein JCM3770_001766 [Rhodotorula araucariae]